MAKLGGNAPDLEAQMAVLRRIRFSDATICTSLGVSFFVLCSVRAARDTGLNAAPGERGAVRLIAICDYASPVNRMSP